MDQYRAIKMEDSKDVALLKAFIEKDCTYDFLAGLNADFDPVRIQILGKYDLPNLNEVVLIILAEESRREVMLETKSLETSAMLTKTAARELRENWKAESKTASGEDEDTLWCTYCNKLRHTLKKCWKLNAKPPSKEWGTKGGQNKPCKGQAYQVIAQQGAEKGLDSTNLNEEEVEKSRNFLAALKKPSGTCSLVHSGISPTSHTV